MIPKGLTQDDPLKNGEKPCVVRIRGLFDSVSFFILLYVEALHSTPPRLTARGETRRFAP